MDKLKENKVLIPLIVAGSAFIAAFLLKRNNKVIS